MRVPPGVTESDFGQALQKFSNVVGAPWVFTRDEDVDLYRDAYSPVRGLGEERVPAAAVAPSSVEQVQEIVRIANQYRVPLYAISTGRNLTYGGSSPVYSGSVVLDLKRMNRVLDISEAGAYCMVEPGVSYLDLYRYIRERGLKLRIDSPDPGWGSPTGNSLERGVGRGVYRDHFRAHCGLEVVLGTGEVVRTGMGALPNGNEMWQRCRYGYGPYIDGIFSSSNFGIVTKFGVHLYPEPEVTRVFDIAVPRYDDLDEFVQEFAYLLNSGVLNCFSITDAPLMQTSIPEAKALMESAGGGTSMQWNALGERLGIPAWQVTQLNCQGPAKIVQAHYDYVIERFSRFKGFKVTSMRDYPSSPDPDKVPGPDKNVLGIPSLVTFAEIGLFGGRGHLDFSPAFPMTGEGFRKVNQLLQQGHRKTGLPWRGWGGSITWFDRTYTMIVPLFLENDPKQNKLVVDTFKHLVELFGANGFAEYRTHPLFQEVLMDQYSFNNHALLRLNETLKDAIDPNGILSAGRAGIWPKHLRDQKKGGKA